MVVVRTAEKDRLIREINHRVGNQLQIISSIVRIERQRAGSDETLATLNRIAAELERMNERHHAYSNADYLGPDVADDSYPTASLPATSS
jgi:two-component sensor histidine kinase